jgi:nickel-dependent lactate racemase
MVEHQLQIGFDTVTFRVAEPARLQVRAERTAPPSLAAAGALLRERVEAPIEFPPLRCAFTPDDHVAIVVADRVAGLGELLPELLRYLLEAGLAAERLTLLVPPRGPEAAPPWTTDLARAFPQVVQEVHDPKDTQRLSYLASTAAGRRVYLNRTLVDADQIVILGEVAYDAIVGYRGGLLDIFPALSDAPTRQSLLSKLDHLAPGDPASTLAAEAREIGWLLGMPFAIEVVAAPDGGVAAIHAGLAGPASERAQRDLDAWFHQHVDRRADLVVVGMGGEPAAHTLADVAQAFHNAAKIVKPDGTIVVMTPARPALGPGSAVYARGESPIQGLALLRQQIPEEIVQFWQLAAAGQRAKLYLSSALAAEAVEDLYLIPVDKPPQVQKLVDQADSVVFLADGHRSRVEVAPARSK